MGESYLSASSISNDIIRLLFSWIDRPIYDLLGFIYKLFFNTASADLFSNDTIMKFYSRVQLILGVFMMFHLAMVILRGIMNPDSFTDSKTGFGNLITRICVALFLLTSLVPISISSPQNEYEKQLNNNGLLFGTLYSLQHRILLNNTIGRLILGTDATTDNFVASGSTDELDNAANIFTASILKGFYRINLKPKEERDKIQACVEADDPSTEPECRLCEKDVDEYIDVYKKIDATPDEIISMVNSTCEFDCTLPGCLLAFWMGDQRYIFTYSPIISSVTGIVFIFILISFTIDVAVRLIKLAILRLIAPIPIISYMDPKGSKDGAFNAWVKTLTSTYLDLFMRLAIVYFVIFLIQEMIVHGIVVNHGEGFLGVLTLIIIWIGLFIFAKQAPKFIRQALGLKDDNFRLFGGISDALGVGSRALGLAASGLGAIGSGIAGYRSSKMSDETRQQFGEDVDPNSRLNKAKHIVAGIAGGLSGGVGGARTALTAKEHPFRSSVENMRKHNQEALARGNDGSSLLGRWKSNASNMFLGEGQADALSREINSNKGRIDALKAIKNRVSGEMVKKDWTSGIIGKYDKDSDTWSYFMKDTSGKDVEGAINYKDFMARKNAAASAGKNEFEIATSKGVRTITMADAERYQGLLLKQNEDDYITKHVSGAVTEDSRLITLIHEAEALGGSSEFKRTADGDITKGDNKKITDRASITDAIDGFEDYNTKLNRKNAVNKANDSYSGKKS